MDATLSTQLRLDGAFRHLQSHNIPYYVVQKGAPYAGVILLKLYDPAHGAQMFTEARSETGAKIWQNPIADGWIEEARADAYIARTRDRDPDVWVIEIETRAGVNPLDYFV